ncbi:MAG: winged helix-turn-helix domain-containing protein [Candidatus Obscuribacterales bacterium]|nr:winged helix-turn-helix domain-containing protein [Candidatus Obscuribacterales bacterium]
MGCLNRDRQRRSLWSRPNSVQTIRFRIWGDGYGDESHYIRVFMAQLRRKLESDPAHPRYFITEPGIGYRLRTNELQPPGSRAKS